MNIVCLGDSLTYGYGLPRKHSYPRLLGERIRQTVINKGITGDTTDGMLSRFQSDVVQSKPRHLIFMGGVNDWNMGMDLPHVTMHTKTIIHQANYYLIKPLILIPVPVLEADDPLRRIDHDRINRLIRELAREIENYQGTGIFSVINLFQLFREAGIGKECYLDAHHLNFQGNQFLVDAIIRHHSFT